ncbi:MAG: DUF4129 domain-containing protein [Thermomicrobiales bacterium]|nr:DUF4129 domain-containing protein [Thermomicrobiales bacterium]
MQSSQSSSPASRQRPPWFDPTFTLLPIFVGVLRAAPLAPFVAMFLGPDFGLSSGLEAPNVWALAILCAVAFWSTRLLPMVIKNEIALNLSYLALGIIGWIVWMALEPDWPIMDVLRNPLTIIGSNGHFVWPFLIAMILWILTLRLALDQRERSSEGVREILMRGVLALLAGVVLASIIGGEMGQDGIHASIRALPAVLVAGIGAVGISEMGETRAAARRRGTIVPSWSRWFRTFSGSAAILLLIVFVAILVLGPGFIDFVLDAIRATWNVTAMVILGIAYALIYAVVYIYRAIAWFLGLFFDFEMAPIEMDSQESGQATPGPGDPPAAQIGEFPAGEIVRIVAIVGVLIIGAAILFRIVANRNQDPDSETEEERESVFSGSLLRNQLRNLFKRKPGAERPRKLDLASDPASVREGMLYLQVLAQRFDIGRDIAETSHDFTSRLADQWPNLGEPLVELNRRYERARYGETEEDRAAVVSAWREIWRDRQEPLRHHQRSD